MAKFRVRFTSFVDNRLVQEGEVIDFDGIPHDNLEPLDQDGEKAASQAAHADLEAIARQKVAAAGADPDDVDTVAAVTAAAKAAETTLQQEAGAAGLV